MYNSIASADDLKFTSINPSSTSEISGLLNEVVQIQNSSETIETQNASIAPSVLPLPAKRYQSAVADEFWNVFKNDLSREEFYSKFREFIFSNWSINENLAGNHLTWFCRDKSDAEKYKVHNQSSFEAELKNQAIQIIGRISKIIEIDIKIKHFEKLEKTSCLDTQQRNQQRSLPREKTKTILKMTDFYCKIYNDIYRVYFENRIRDLNNTSTEDISKIIKASASKRNTATKRIKEIKPSIKFDLLEKFQLKVDDYLADLDNSSKKSAISISNLNEASLLDLFQAEPSKSELNGKKIDANQGRLFDIIKNKIIDKSIISTDRDYIFNPKHGNPARYYYTQIPTLDLKCKELLIKIKIEILNLLRNENTHNSENQKEIINKSTKIDTIFIKYIQSVLEQQKYTEITYSEKKNTIPEDMTITRMNTWISKIKKKLPISERELNIAKETLDKAIDSTGINEEEMIIPYLLQYLNTKGEELIYNELSQQKYRELIGIQVRKKEDILPSNTAMIMERSDSTEDSTDNFLEELNIELNSFIKAPPKEHNKEELNAKEREVLNSLYEKMRNNKIITEIGIRNRKCSVPNYYSARKQFYLNWYQIDLLELKVSLANFIIQEQTKISNSLKKIEEKFSNKKLDDIEEIKSNFLNKISNTLKRRENRFINSKALKKAEKFARHALRHMAYSYLLEGAEENTVLDKRAENWMHVSPLRMETIENKLNTTQEKLNNILKDPRINMEEFNTRFESFVSSKLLETGLVSVILNIPCETKVPSPSSEPTATNNDTQVGLQERAKRSHDEIVDDKEPKAKKLKLVSDEEDDDDIEEDSDLLAFLNDLHDSGLANMNLAEDLMIDDEFVDSLLKTDVSGEQLINNVQLLSKDFDDVMFSIAQKSMQDSTELNFQNIDFHLPNAEYQSATDHFAELNFATQISTRQETLGVDNATVVKTTSPIAQISYADTSTAAIEIDSDNF